MTRAIALGAIGLQVPNMSKKEVYLSINGFEANQKCVVWGVEFTAHDTLP